MDESPSSGSPADTPEPPREPAAPAPAPAPERPPLGPKPRITPRQSLQSRDESPQVRRTGREWWEGEMVLVGKGLYQFGEFGKNEMWDHDGDVEVESCVLTCFGMLCGMVKTRTARGPN